MLTDLDLILAGADTRRLAGRIGRTLCKEMPSSKVVIARRSGNREVILYGNPDFSAAAAIGLDELRQSRAGYVVRVLAGDDTATAECSYLRFAPLLLALADARRVDHLTARTNTPSPSTRPVGSSRRMLELFDQAARVARSDLSVLICGESGTGKELLARHIHDSSPRARGPFIAVNCAGLPPDLVEAELFGVERGAATGVDARPGRFEQAASGTLLLDEIGDMAPRTQATILRTLEDGLIFRVGSTRPRPVSVRVIAATNREVKNLVRTGLFRADLYYRIASWVCHLPPLRERGDDILHLAFHFLADASPLRGTDASGITDEAMAALAAYDWPGNVRQLRNEIQRARAIAPDGDPIDVEHLSSEVTRRIPNRTRTSLRTRLRTLERQIIEDEIESCGSALRAVADRLEIPLSTLYRRMKVLGVTPPHHRRPTSRSVTRQS